MGTEEAAVVPKTEESKPTQPPQTHEMSWLHSEKVDKISEALAKAQGEFEVVAKTKDAKIPIKDKQTGKPSGKFIEYSYPVFADFKKATQKALAKNNLAVLQPIVTKGGTQHLATILSHSSGQYFKGFVPLNSDTSGRKNTFQALGSAQTYLMRYCYCAMLSMGPEEDDDAQRAEAIDQYQNPQQPQNNRRPQQANKPPEPMSKKQGGMFWSLMRELSDLKYGAKEMMTEDEKNNAKNWAEKSRREFCLECGIEDGSLPKATKPQGIELINNLEKIVKEERASQEGGPTAEDDVSAADPAADAAAEAVDKEEREPGGDG